jgi:hypothetical protein
MRDLFTVVTAHHTAVVQPMFSEVAMKFEVAISMLDQTLFNTQKHLNWLSQDARQSQFEIAKRMCVIHGFTKDIPPQARCEALIDWMGNMDHFANRVGYLANCSRRDIRYTDILIHILTCAPQTAQYPDGNCSTVTVIAFKEFDDRQKFYKSFQGNQRRARFLGCWVSITPSSPRFVRKLESPLKTLVATLSSSTDPTVARGEATILWPTCTLMEYQTKRCYDENHIAWAQLRFTFEGEELVATMEIEEKCLTYISKETEVEGKLVTLWDQAWNKQMHKIQHDIDEAEDQAINNVGSYEYTRGPSIRKTPHWTMNFTSAEKSEWDYPLRMKWLITKNSKNEFIGYDQKIYDEKMATFGLYKEQASLMDSAGPPSLEVVARLDISGKGLSKNLTGGAAPPSPAPTLPHTEGGNTALPVDRFNRGGGEYRQRNSPSPARGGPYQSRGSASSGPGPHSGWPH